MKQQNNAAANRGTVKRIQKRSQDDANKALSRHRSVPLAQSAPKLEDITGKLKITFVRST